MYAALVAMIIADKEVYRDKKRDMAEVDCTGNPVAGAFGLRQGGGARRQRIFGQWRDLRYRRDVGQGRRNRHGRDFG